MGKIEQPMGKLFLTVLLATSLLSCSTSPKIKDAEALGKEIFNLFKNGEKDKIVNYLVTKEEMRKAFDADKEFAHFSETQKDEFINSSYQQTEKFGMGFINLYTDKSSKETLALQKGVLEKVSSYPKNEKGPPAVRIEVQFAADGEKYFLLLDAAKIDDYWKLLSWIEVRKV